MDSFDLQSVLLALPILMLSLSAHEFGHAWVALKQGDRTAYNLGRVTMNPAAHVDWLGTVVFPAIAIGTGAPLLGWAKPVPTQPRNYRNYRRGDLLVSLAGVAVNAILALLFALVCWALAAAAGPTPSNVLTTAFRMAFYGVYGNVGLVVFNLLPVPPLDGSRVLYHFLSPRAAAAYRGLTPYGFFILYGLVLTGVLRVLAPLIWGPTVILLQPAVFANPAFVQALG